MKKEIEEAIIGFSDDRNWTQFHNPKDLAISLSIEAAELLETFQWKTWEEALEEKAPEIEEELADILIYAVLFAHRMGFDVEEIIRKKLVENAQKYPIEKAYGNREKYTEL